MKKRSIPMCVIFTIITLGLYGLYWIASMQNFAKSKTGQGFGGFGTILVSMLTGGLYSFYWMFAMGGRLHKAGAPKDNALIYLILSICALGIVNMCLMQNDINDIIEHEETGANSVF